MKTCKMNVVCYNGSHEPTCTNCGHRFNTDEFAHPYNATCEIAMGKYAYCPHCGALYVGCQINGKDFNRCDVDIRDWISRRSFSLRLEYDRRVKAANKLLKSKVKEESQ